MDVIVEKRNDLDLILKFIDFKVLCVLVKVIAKLKSNIQEFSLSGYSIATKEDEIEILSESGKLLTIKVENGEDTSTSDKRTYKVDIRQRIKEIVNKGLKSETIKYSQIIMSGEISNHDSIEELTEDDLKGLSRKVSTTNSSGYRVINYLSDDRVEDYEFVNIANMLKTGKIKSQLFDSDDLHDIIDQLNGEYKKSTLDNESGKQEESAESITFNEQPNSEPVENDESGDYEGQFLPGRRGAYRKYRLAELRDKHNYTL